MLSYYEGLCHDTIIDISAEIKTIKFLFTFVLVFIWICLKLLMIYVVNVTFDH